MATFIISSREEIECETEEEAIEWLFQFLVDCVKDGDVSTFNFEKVKG